jgi:hypothetical protein
VGTEPVDYCREIEAYLCRKNDGHLIRVVGPSFELVSGWAAAGVPLKVAFRGIDRYFERYYRKGPRRRPVRIDFCDADVQDVFDEWRRALGLTTPSEAGEDTAGRRSENAPLPDEGGRHRGPSLASHLERALARLTTARATGRIGAAADALLDRVSAELDAARASARGLRGDARQALLERLDRLDEELFAAGLRDLGEADRVELAAQADEELGPFRTRMAADAYDRARALILARLVRERFALPTLHY